MKNQSKRILQYFFYRNNKVGAFFRLAAKRAILNKMSFRSCNGAITMPETLMIRITNRCNLHCFFCGQHGERGVFEGSSARPNEKELSISQWKDFIKNARYFKPYIYITGGEPLLRDDTVELIKFASSLDIITHLNTNSTLLSDKAEDLVNAGLDYISCSLDCIGSLSEEITGKSSTYKDAITGIERLVKARSVSKGKFPIIQVFTTINKKNQHCLFDIAKTSEALGVDVFAVSFPIFTTPELEQKTSISFREKLGVEPKFWKGFISDMSQIDCNLIEKQIKLIRESRFGFRYKQFPSPVKGFSVYNHFRLPAAVHGDKVCMIPWSMAIILPNGEVSTCWDHPDYIVGNICKEKFSDIWNGEKYRKFRKIIKKEFFPSCSRCTGLYFN